MLGDRGWSEGTEGVSDSALADVDSVAPGIVDKALSMTLPGESTIDALIRAASTVVMADTQRRILNIQIDRMRQGLPPLNASQYSPGVGVNVGLSPEIMKMVALGGAALLAVWFLSRRKS